MSDMFSRLGRIARSVINDFNSEVDRDFKDAWSELNDFLGTEEHHFSDGSGNAHARHGNNSEGTGEQRSAQQPALARDYANLELQPQAGFDEVKASYKRLLKKYHPDRFGDDAEKQALATELSARLNDSYQRILDSRGWH